MGSKTKYNVEMVREVRWGEMDALGHVNNAEYFSYFEDVRIAYMHKLGFTTVTSQNRLGPILASISCDFKKPILFPDTLTVGTGVSRIGNSSAQLDYEIYSEKYNEIVATGESVMVLMDYTEGKSIPIPEDIRKKIEEIEGRPS